MCNRATIYQALNDEISVLARPLEEYDSIDDQALFAMLNDKAVSVGFHHDVEWEEKFSVFTESIQSGCITLLSVYISGPLQDYSVINEVVKLYLLEGVDDIDVFESVLAKGSTVK